MGLVLAFVPGCAPLELAGNAFHLISFINGGDENIEDNGPNETDDALRLRQQREAESMEKEMARLKKETMREREKAAHMQKDMAREQAEKVSRAKREFQKSQEEHKNRIQRK